MKTIFYIFVLLFGFHASAQSNYVTNVMDNPDGQSTFLYDLPWDQTQLVQVKREWLELPEYHYEYEFEMIDNGVASQLYIPFCANISTEPLFLEDGILATGKTPLNGFECVFFDGINVTEFDLNIGEDDSEPYFRLVDDHVFILANDGNAKQLYEFDKVNHTVTQITNSSVDIKNVCGTWGDAVYFSTEFANLQASQMEYELIKASVNSGTYSYSTVHTYVQPSAPIQSFFWGAPIVKSGKLFLTQEDRAQTFGEFSHLKIISIDSNDQVEIVHELPPSAENILVSFEWDNALWSYVNYSNELYKSTDGISFVLDVDSGSKKITNHHIAANNKLFLDLYIQASDDHEIARHFGPLQTIYTGKHLHFLLEDNGTLYLSETWDNNTSSIILLHTAFDGVEEILINQGIHSPASNAALMFNSEFTFLYSYEYENTDILKLTGSPSAGIPALDLSLKVYPNPISAGESLILELSKNTKGELLSTSGQLVQALDLHSGINLIPTSTLKSGVYFIRLNERTQRIFVN